MRLSATPTVSARTPSGYTPRPRRDPTGWEVELPIGSNQVSQMIWIVVVAGGGLLFGAIALRLVRRLRRPRPASE